MVGRTINEDEMTRDEERFITCLKKSKSKVIKCVYNAFNHYCYFQDVNQTGWTTSTILDMSKRGDIELEIIGVDLYRVSVNSTNC